jgi:uncharacterized lipoprotein YmbA
MRRWTSVATLAAAAVAAGCAASSATTRYYTLSAEPAPAAKAAPGAATGVRTVAVWQVAIPDIVDRRALVLRTAPNQVEISDLHQWAEPLRLGIARALADDLAAQLGPGYAVVAGQPLGVAPAVRIFVDVQRFEAGGGKAEVEMLWSVRPAQGERRDGRSAAEEPAPADPGAIAAAYSRVLARIARDIAPAVAASRDDRTN